MRNFADQSMDIAQLLVGHCCEQVGENGVAIPSEGEWSTADEAGHMAYGLAVYRDISQQAENPALIDAIARCIAGQFYFYPDDMEGTIFAMLALLTCGLNLDRNPIWERLLGETQEKIRQQLSQSSRNLKWPPVYRIIHALVRFSLGFCKKDDTDKAIDYFIAALKKENSSGLVDTSTAGLGGLYDASGLGQFVLLREALQRHANSHIRERRLPSLRTCAERYLRILPDLVRPDGTCWFFGRESGCHSLLYTISFILTSLLDGWIEGARRKEYIQLVGRLFQNLFMQYLDQERGLFCIRDKERNTVPNLTTVKTNFDALRMLSFWKQWAGNIRDELDPTAPATGSTARGKFILFDRNNRKEQGVFLYSDGQNLQVQLPIMSGNGEGTCDCLAYPHAPGLIDAPVNGYLPVLLPELFIDGQTITPSFYGKNISTGLGIYREFQLRYEQPELINNREEILPGLGSWKVEWSFAKDTISGNFLLSPQKSISIENFRFAIVISAPHSKFVVPGYPTLGENGLQPQILQDDFQGEWLPIQNVVDDPDIRTAIGKVTYLQIYAREIPLQLKANRQYRFHFIIKPQILTL